MIIFHAGIQGDQFLLWGETPANSTAVSAKRSGRKPAATARRAFTLPYDVGADRLTLALTEAMPVSPVSQAQAEAVIVWLPTVNGWPHASSPLIAELPEANGQAELAPWKVTALAFPTAQAIDLLCVCANRETLAPGLIVGVGLAFWAAAMRFAGSIVARQLFLPGIDLRDSSTHARWEPVFVGADAQRLAQLAALMPHACRALTKTATIPPDTPALTVLSAFLTKVVDGLIRSAIMPSGGATISESRLKKNLTFESVHDEWLHALRTPDGRMTGETTELAQLAQQVREWQRPITTQTATPFRLCLRLEEPEEIDTATRRREGAAKLVASPADDGAWYIRYLLQAADDPSLIVPVSQVWNAKGRQAALLKRGSFKPREYLLSTLGQAAKINADIGHSLKTAAPDGYNLDAMGAHKFLQEQAWALEQAGFGVMLPAWWTRKGTKLRLTARANVRSSKLKGGGMSLDEIIKFEWEVALGDEKLSLQELEMLARIKAPLVRVRGQWVELNGEEIQAALNFWKKKATGTARVRDIVQMALGAGHAPGGISFAGVTATGWIGDMLAQLEGRKDFTEMHVPDNFQGTLRPYQVRGFSWLGFLRQWGLGACLADDMGLGKTPQTLALIQSDWQLAMSHRPTLVVCPMSVVGNWQKEAARFTPDLPVMVHHGLTRAKGKDFKKAAEKNVLVLSSYALLHRDFEFLKEVEWAGVILDEAQNIKNAQTKQAQAARALSADYRVALTGTPVENNVGDLWSIMEFLNPGFLGTQAEFKRNYFLPIQTNRDEEATTRLKRLTGPFILRRLKTDKTIIRDLPEKMEMKVFCTLTKEQASLYAAVVKDASEALDATEGIQRKGVVLATLTKLKQVCNHPAQFLGDNSSVAGRSGKLARLAEMLEEVLSTGERALVFTQFTEMGQIIRRHLQEMFGHEVLFLHGAVPKKQRDRMVMRFQSDNGGPRIFLLSLKAGGTGLNLTAANHVFHFDRWWNPAVENQATDRAFRIGQKKNVQVHKYICAGTLEEKIDEMIERKQEMAAQVVGTGEGWLTELSTPMLKELFALREGAVGE
ncbi:MAG: DEAD/DEAH box helicase, partial [Pyrinomonadaceae bacterium]|nr:DEAD/DEAH box helicase [Pyrinomonadaceae bacterium]